MADEIKTKTQPMESRRSSRSLPLLEHSANNWGYRAQLDGLRAVAVYLVVAFHAESVKLEGGFVGVDLFFVLSGFLVTNVILTDLADEGRLRLRRFYARRIRRLIPAAAIAVVGTSVFAVLISNPLDRSSWSGDATASSLWYANWHFIGKANDYFLSNDATSPFQHFWSLAIEEQFYLAFPAVLISLWLLMRRNVIAITGIVAVLMIAGVGLQLYSADRDPNRSYLGTDTRAYQLLVGVLLALLIWRWALPLWLKRWAPWSALASLATFLFVSSKWFDVSASTRGLAAAFAAGWCVLSVQTAETGLVYGFLSWTPIRYLGQISYGTYLWHWPVVVLSLQLVEISPKALFIASAVLGTALAALSYELVELHVRKAGWLGGRPNVVIIAGVALALGSGLIIAPVLLESGRKPSITPLLVSAEKTTVTQVEPDNKNVTNSKLTEDPNTATTTAAGETGPQLVPDDIDWETARLAPPNRCSDCIVSAGNSGTMLLLGDSHAHMFLPAFQIIAEQRDVELAMSWFNSCPWMESSISPNPNSVEGCITRNQELYDYKLDDLDPDIIVLAGFPYSIRGTTDPSGKVGSSDPGFAKLPYPEVLEALITDSITTLSAGNRQLVFVEPTPIFESNPLNCLSGARTVGRCAFPPLLSELEEDLYREAADRSDFVTSVDLDPIACPRVSICDPLQRGYPVWRDDDHFTVKFAEQLAPLIDEELAQAGVFDPIANSD